MQLFCIVVLGVAGGDHYTCWTTQTSLDGSTVYIQDFSSWRWKCFVIIISCTSVWLFRVSGNNNGHGHGS